MHSRINASICRYASRQLGRRVFHSPSTFNDSCLKCFFLHKDDGHVCINKDADEEVDSDDGEKEKSRHHKCNII